MNRLVNQIKKFDWTRQKGQLSEFFRSTLQKVSWKSPRVLGGLFGLLVLISGLTYYVSTTTAATEVLVNGQEVGFVRNLSTAQAMVATILQEQGKPFGVMAKTREQITFKNLRVKPAEYASSAIDQNTLSEKLTCYLDGYDLEVNGAVIAVLPSKQAVDKVLQEYQDNYVKPSAENKVTSVSFAEKTDSKQVEVTASQIKQPDEVLNLLLNGETVTTDYTVKPKDSLWLIARKNNMLTDEVVAGNPGFTRDTVIKPGQIIKLVDVSPYLTVVAQGTFTGTEVIPYDVQTKTDSRLRSNRSKVVTQGSNGTKLVTYSYVQQNGSEIKHDVLKEQVLQSPVTEVIARGPNSSPIQVAFNPSRGGSGSSGIVDKALSFLGRSYVFGGTTPSGFDCSGFTKYVYSSVGISLPRTSYDQFASGDHVSIDQLQPGDLVFFSTYTRGASHVGIYIGGGRFVHASNPSDGVKISSLNSSYYTSRYLGARRY